MYHKVNTSITSQLEAMLLTLYLGFLSTKLGSLEGSFLFKFVLRIMC